MRATQVALVTASLPAGPHPPVAASSSSHSSVIISKIDQICDKVYKSKTSISVEFYGFMRRGFTYDARLHHPFLISNNLTYRASSGNFLENNFLYFIFLCVQFTVCFSLWLIYLVWNLDSLTTWQLVHWFIVLYLLFRSRHTWHNCPVRA